MQCACDIPPLSIEVGEVHVAVDIHGIIRTAPKPQYIGVLSSIACRRTNRQRTKYTNAIVPKMWLSTVGTINGVGCIYISMDLGL